MSRRAVLVHQFVHHIPEHLVDGVLYISVAFSTVLHRCCCGCGNEVVTPLSPSDWRMTFDGESISLCPSIGNRSFDCQSHYYIRHNEVFWLRSFAETELEPRPPRSPLWHRLIVRLLRMARWKWQRFSAPRGV